MDSLAQLWDNFLGRYTGPMNLRLLLQPAIASFFGIRSGLRDHREGRKPYLSTLISQSGTRKTMLKEAWDHVGKVFVIASILDGIYQYIVFHRVSVAGVIIMAVTLALFPYLVFRGFLNRSLTLRSSHKGRIQPKPQA